MKILLIEDEIELLNSIKSFLKNEGHIVETAPNFKDAVFKISDYNYDCILIDITLPFGNGLEIIKHLKQEQSESGIIIISAKNSIEDKIIGLDLGADDYLAKPFDLAELNSRIRALLRRKNFKGMNTIELNEIKILPDERTVLINKEPINLTGKEYDLLLFFIVNKNRVVSKNTIAEHLWGDDSDQWNNHDFIYVHMRNLRKKILEKNCRDYIQTIYGIGYKFNSEQ